MDLGAIADFFASLKVLCYVGFANVGLLDEGLFDPGAEVRLAVVVDGQRHNGYEVNSGISARTDCSKGIQES